MRFYCVGRRWMKCEYKTMVEYRQRKTDVLGMKPLTVPICLPQIPHGVGWDRARASAVRARRLTFRDMDQPRAKWDESQRRRNV